MRLIVASTQNHPAIRLYVSHTLDDRIVFDARARRINRNALCVERNRDVGCIRITRNGWLKHAWRPIAHICQRLKVRRQARRNVFARHRLTRVHDVEAARPSNIQLSLEYAGLQGGIECLTGLEPHQKVNAVLVCRLPLVDSRPRISLAISLRSNGSCARSKDESVRLVLELGG